MSESFRGEFNQKVDAKARVSIPAPFRRVIEGGDPAAGSGTRARFVMVYGGGAGRKYVECYTVQGMERIDARIRKMKPGSPERALMQRNFNTLAQTVEIDEDGRVVLPPKVREKMGMGAEAMKESAEAVFAGALDTFQLWLQPVYEAEMAAAAALEDALLPEGADMLSLLPFDEDEV